MKPHSSENMCRILVESLNQVLFTLDDKGKITCVSDGCKESMGFLPEEMIGRPVSAFMVPEDKGCFSEQCDQAKQGNTHPVSFHVVGKEGGFYPARAIFRSMPDGQEKSGMIGLIGEISTGKQTKKMILEANTRIHHLNSIVRHDINNQLTVLHGYLSLMEQNDDRITSQEMVRILLDATDKIYNTVTFTTEYKDIGTHLPIWMNLYEAFDSARTAVDAGSVQITPEPECQDLELFCDPMIIKVFHHLIDNSLLYGQTVSEISLQWSLKNGSAIIVYKDNGTGIAEILKPTLFEPDKGKKTMYGLLLVQEIIGIYGFTITETGIPGKGVRFEIVVPAGSFKGS